ncbi:alkylmercury lyase family protein [Pendulispora albinea]|uniref:Alkylmercury lyase family protein n=1 Tax=Pendulispora albinea TaxID=2741071 RepID=A0ABZ2M5A3_9BACT
MEDRVHHHVIDSFVRRGYPSTAWEIAADLGATSEQVAATLRRLHDGHGLVLHPGSLDVWIAHPFSASPTAVWVAEGERGWWAPCMWCALGVAVLAAPNATIHARIGGEHEPVQIQLHDGAVAEDSSSLGVHFAVPLRDAWANVVHFCSTVLPFRSAADVERWCERHRIAQGAVVPVAQALDLARAWYGHHLDRDWRKWTLQEAQAIFERVGLTGPFFRLPVSDGVY